jgi:3-methyladenine DNA glycosylase/8-oxoguanine DNA glycosylase
VRDTGGVTAEPLHRPTAVVHVRVPGSVDVRATLSALRRGGGDPQMRVAGAAVWRASRTPAGPVTFQVEPIPGAGQIAVTCWGPGGGWLAEHAGGLVGADDDVAGWTPAHPLLRELWRRLPGLRVPRTRLVLEALVPSVLEQKVTGDEARRSWRDLLLRHGEPAPGPAGLRLPPTAERLAVLPSWDWHRAGVEQKRALTIRSAALRAAKLEECADMAPSAARARLQVLPGVGVWTSAEVAQRAFGDADAVSVGDYHLPGLVGWALAGRRTDDDGMLELLEPERPHRYRAVRLLELTGPRPQRRGPRMPARRLRQM